MKWQYCNIKKKFMNSVIYLKNKEPMYVCLLSFNSEFVGLQLQQNF